MKITYVGVVGQRLGLGFRIRANPQNPSLKTLTLTGFPEVMAPGADFLNHSASGANAELAIDVEGGLVIKATKEVLLQYSKP